MPIQYYMRAYKTTPTIGYVSWVVNDIPDSTGQFSGFSPSDLINIIINKVVQSKIENSIIGEPRNNTDGYVFHVNNYDWLEQVPVDVPSKAIGFAAARGTADGYTPRAHSGMYWDENSNRWIFAQDTTPPTPNGFSTVTFGDSLGISVNDIINNSTVNPVSSTGFIKNPSGVSIITYRDSFDNQDIDVLSLDGNKIVLGDSSGVAPNIYVVGDGYAHEFLSGSKIITEFSVDGNGPNITIGSSAATDGYIRVPNNVTVLAFRDVVDTNDIRIITTTSSDTIFFGDDIRAAEMYYDAATDGLHSFRIAGMPIAHVNSEELAIDLNLSIGSISSYGGGSNVIFLTNAVVAPTSDPVGGGILYVESGALKFRGSSGTITTICPA